MTATVRPGPLHGTVQAPPSKSLAHRQIVCAALCEGRTDIVCPGQNADIEATLRCVQALCAHVGRTQEGFVIRGRVPSARAVLDCGESGSTLRFLLPVCAALGCEGELHCAGRLALRPMEALRQALEPHGIRLSEAGSNPIRLRGSLSAGSYRVAGNVSSQFVSGLLLALPLLAGESGLLVEGPLSSADYVGLTLSVMEEFGVRPLPVEGGWRIPAGACYTSPGRVRTEGDWSGAAFWLCAGVPVAGLCAHSGQADRAVLSVLSAMGAQTGLEGGVHRAGGELCGTVVDADPIPDLVPPIAAAAVHARGVTRICNARRLRDKESDRLQTLSAALRAMGARVEEGEDSLTVFGGIPLSGGRVQACGDHRIAMAAAIAALRAEGPTEIVGAEAVGKSYPDFWRDLAALGGRVTLS